MKTLILFDIGAVLIGLDFSRFYRKVAKTAGDRGIDITPDEFKQSYVASNLEEMLLEGRIEDANWLERMKKLSGYAMTSSEMADAYKLIFTEPIQEMIGLKKTLHNQGYAVGLFSNICPMAQHTVLAMSQELFEVFDPNNPAIFSYQVHAVKPKRPMYEAIQGFERVILIDDKPSYLEVGIEQFGWNGIHFTPFIDKSEAIRCAKGHNKKYSSAHSISASSVAEVEQALGHFEVHL